MVNGIFIRVKIKERDKRNLFKIPFNVYFLNALKFLKQLFRFSYVFFIVSPNNGTMTFKHFRVFITNKSYSQRIIHCKEKKNNPCWQRVKSFWQCHKALIPLGWTRILKGFIIWRVWCASNGTSSWILVLAVTFCIRDVYKMS